ncbi:MAG: maleylpyruvate isomerase family mycothiol-dependent enzyme [Actinobacteria bacterium]|nr:maleylpyruvate isomerase family mycothiol-dependent enzyme [Actinomycetota bacterium]
MTEPLDAATTIRFFEAEAAALASLVATTDLAAAVPSCPGWTVSKLASHVGTVHRWAAAIVEAGSTVDPKSLDLGRPDREAGNEEWSRWLTAGATDLAELLRSVDPSATTWSWAAGEDGTNAWWIRRQLHETAVHRIDAELAAGNEDWTIDPAVAVDAIDEHLANLAGSAAFSEGVANLVGTGERDGQSLHLHATDVDGEWMIQLTRSSFEISHSHGKGTVAVRGAARDLLAVVTNRSNGTDRVEFFGDSELLTWWRTNSALG